MAKDNSAETAMHGLASGNHRVVELLLDEGRLPDGWAASYCTFLAEALANSKAGDFWSWPLFQAIHFVSAHLHFRYRVWCRSTERANPETELLLGRVQLESELFLWNSVCGSPSFLDSVNRSSRQEVDERDVMLVNLCFEDNGILRRSDGADDSVVAAWRQEYRTALSTIGVKWQLSSHVWKWLALAVRFASFYLDLAMIRREDQRRCDHQRGLEPDRIQETLQRLQTQISNGAVIGVIDLWLRLCQLPRDSSGLPSILSSTTSSMRSVGVRTASELFLQADSGS